MQKHKIKLLKLFKLSLKDLDEIINLIFAEIKFIDEFLLPNELLIKVENQLSLIDKKDTTFVALAKHMKAKLWTGDLKLYKGLKAIRVKNVLTTLEMLLLLEEFENY